MATQNVFGKRGTQKAAIPVSSRAKKRSPSRSISYQPATQQCADNGTFEFRYTPQMTWAGILILAPVVSGTMGFSTDWSKGGASDWEQWLFSLVPWIMAVLGAFWVFSGLRGGLALRVTPEGVSAMTLYGPAFHKWNDIGRMTVNRKPNFLGDQFLSLLGADTSTLSSEVTIYPAMRLSTWYRTPIEVRVDNTDASLEEILGAIARYRPDIVERPSWF